MIPVSYNVRSLLARRSTTLAAALGVGLVVFVFASVLMLANGIERTLRSSGKDTNAIIIRKGSQSETMSGIEDTAVSILRAAPEAKPSGNGTLSTAEVVVIIGARRADNPEGMTNVIVRGVMPETFQVRDQVRIIEGRPFTPGSNEVIIGKKIQGRIDGLGLGREFALKPNRSVNVVGVFDSDGSSLESEIWGDLDTVRAIFNRTGAVSSVTLALRDAALLEKLKTRVESDPRLGVEVKRETTYYEEQSQNLAMFVSVVGTMIAIFFAFGAMIGAMITMYAQVAQRGKEIGTLRALGFRRRSVLGSFLIEAVLLSLGGGALGAVAALGMSAVSFSTVNFASFSEIVFTFTPTPGIIVTALVFASVMGLVGGLLPALRAAKVSPIEAMRG